MSNSEEQRDRISLDLMGLRSRLEKVIWEPGQPLSSVLRGVAFIGVELIEICTKRRIPQPKSGQVEEWLDRLQNDQENSPNKTENKAEEVLDFVLSATRPDDVEIVRTAARLGVDTEKLLDAIARIHRHNQEHCTNGH